MFRKLRVQFIVMTMSIISIILIVSFTAIYLSTAHSLHRSLDPPPRRLQQQEESESDMLYFEQQRARYAERALTELVITLIVAGAGTLIAVYFVSRYVANRAIRPIEEAYEKQRQFVADASHELKTPITIIGANVDAAIGDRKKPSKWLENIRREVDHTGTLITDLLTLATIDAEKLPVNKKSFDATKVVSELTDQFAVLAAEKRITLSSELPTSLPITSDEDKLRQILSILLDNAIKHTKNNGTVVVTARQGTDETVFVVENSHEDIPAEKLALLFERFYQTDESHSNVGHGLGLAIADKIARQMKWPITVSSKNGIVAFTVVLKH